MARTWPTGKGGKDAKAAILKLERNYGWVYSNDVGNSSHHIGWLSCPDGCRTKVHSTANNTVKALWRFARKCPHGHRPDEIKP